jgi:putative iron-regulated protein
VFCAGAGTVDDERASLKRAIVRHYAEVADANYQDALAGVGKLAEAVESLVARPSASALERARQAWIEARRPYIQSEVFRFYEGPIDEVEGFINAWPIDEGLIDYVVEDPASGIINHPEQNPTLSRELILGLNEKTGERSITTGFHAIEFLLWGQDGRSDGPGDRSWQDYITATNAVRRGTYLRVASQLLVTHLQQVRDAWAPEQSKNYRAEFVSLAPDIALGRILKGLGSLSGSELSGERLTVPYQTKEQEDEHSCFSDTTHLDLQYDGLGIENVYLGRYTRVDGTKLTGPGLRDLLARDHPELAELLSRQIEASLRASRSIPVPFDRAIMGVDTAPGRVAVLQAIKAYQALADTIAKVAAVLGVPLNL